MKMAKASQADMEMALTLCSALEAIERRFFPEGTTGDDDPEALDLHDDAHCGRVLRHLDRVLNGGSIGPKHFAAVMRELKRANKIAAEAMEQQ